MLTQKNCTTVLIIFLSSFLIKNIAYSINDHPPSYEQSTYENPPSYEQATNPIIFELKLEGKVKYNSDESIIKLDKFKAFSQKEADEIIKDQVNKIIERINSEGQEFINQYNKLMYISYDKWFSKFGYKPLQELNYKITVKYQNEKDEKLLHTFPYQYPEGVIAL